MPIPTLYHRANALYRPGEHIAPGNWGRLLTGIGALHTHFFREYALESLRAAEFPTLPSRLAASFAFEDLTAAEGFVQNADWPTYTYLVRPLDDPPVTLHRGDTGWFDQQRLAQLHTFAAVGASLRGYWEGRPSPSPRWEWLFPCALVVERRLTPILDDVDPALSSG